MNGSIHALLKHISAREQNIQYVNVNTNNHYRQGNVVKNKKQI
jgi:hypothetical protein